MVDSDFKQQVIDMIPQQPPFRFVDEIIDIDDERICASYRFKKEEAFYKGHFPNRPITPGVILIETMAQTSVVAMGISLLMRQGTPRDEIKKMITLFAYADQVEFNGLVLPGEKVIARGEKIYLRRGTLKSRASLERENGEIVCTGIMAGIRG